MKPARATNAVRTGNTTVVVESPFGAPLHVLVQCAPIADGFTAYMVRPRTYARRDDGGRAELASVGPRSQADS